jgi:hypothetical protein
MSYNAAFVPRSEIEIAFERLSRLRAHRMPHCHLVFGATPHDIPNLALGAPVLPITKFDAHVILPSALEAKIVAPWECQ